VIETNGSTGCSATSASCGGRRTAVLPCSGIIVRVRRHRVGAHAPAVSLKRVADVRQHPAEVDPPIKSTSCDRQQFHERRRRAQNWSPGEESLHAMMRDEHPLSSEPRKLWQLYVSDRPARVPRVWRVRAYLDEWEGTGVPRCDSAFHDAGNGRATKSRRHGRAM